MKKILTTENLIYLTIFLLPIYLLRFQIFGVPTNVLEILILLTAFSFFYQAGNLRHLRVNVDKYVLPLSLILFGLCVSLAVNGNFRSGLGILKSWFLLPLLFAFVVATTAKDAAVRKNMLSALYFSTFCVSLISLAYYISGILTYDGRLSAFYLSPNYLAMYLAPGVIIGLTRIKYSVLSIKNFKFIFFIFSFAIISSAFYFTNSYAAWLAVILSLAGIKLLKKIPFKKVCLLVLITIALLFIGQRHNPKFQDLVNLRDRSSLSSRHMIWQASARILQDHWLLGIGPGNFQATYLQYQRYFPPYLEWAVPQPHNIFLAFWLQGGVLSFLGFLWLIYRWLKNLYKKIGQPLPELLLTLMLYTLLHGLVDTTYWKNDLALIFWLIFALGIIPTGIVEVKKKTYL